MALLVDGNPSELVDLGQYESAIFDVAATEGIDVAAKANLTAMTIRMELQRFLQGGRDRASYQLGNIVVTEGLRHWHVLRTLAAVYRDAYFQQLNDRYQPKWKEYDRLGKEIGRLYLETGVGVVSRPIPRAAQPAMGQVPGGFPSLTYYARVAWVDANGQAGEASEAAAVTTQENTLLTVRPVDAPAVATAWRVYVGYAADEVTAQTSEPLQLGTVWQMTADGPGDGPAPAGGQQPERYLRQHSLLQRG